MSRTPEGQPRPRSARWGNACVALLLSAAFGCQLFEPTIPQRRAREDEGRAAWSHQQSIAELAETHDTMMTEMDVDVEKLASEPPPVEVRPVPNPIGGDDPVSLELRDTSLAHAIHLIAELAGANVYFDAALDRRVDCSFPNVRLDDALHLLLERNGLRLAEDPVGIYWVDLADGSQPATAHFKAQSIDVTEIEANLNAITTEDTRIVVDAGQNLIVARGPQSEVDLVEGYLAAADELKRQVLIEVRLLEVSLEDDFELGISGRLTGTWNGDTISIIQSLASSARNFELLFDSESGNVEATIQALSEYVGVSILSTPKILTVTNSEALFEVLEEVPYVNVTSTTTGTTGGIGSTVIEEVQFKEVGIRLAVTPTIQEGGNLQIVIDQEFSEVIALFNEIPVVDARHITSTFLVENRGTIVLGGLMQTKDSETDRGVPVLMDIPIVGRLFRADSDSGRRRELLVFLTPRIVSPSEAAHLSGVVDRQFSQRHKGAGVESD